MSANTMNSVKSPSTICNHGLSTAQTTKATSTKVNTSTNCSSNSVTNGATTSETYSPRKQFSFIKKFNPFSSNNSSSSTVKSKIEAAKSRYSFDEDGISEERRDVKSLKQFWNDHIRSSAKRDSGVKPKSATLGGYNRSKSCAPLRNSPDVNNCDFQFKRAKSNSVPSLLDVPLPAQRYDRSEFSTSEFNKSIDNFDKFKTAETVKSRRRSRDIDTCVDVKPTKSTVVPEIKTIIPNFPLVAATSDGTKIHWAKRDDIKLVRSTSKTPKSPEMILNDESQSKEKFKIYEDRPTRSNTTMVSDMVDMQVVTGDPNATTKVKLGPKSSNDAGSKVPVRKISFRTNKTPTNSYHRRLKAENSSRVAALTHRFNQMVQEDEQLLTEIKKHGTIVKKVGNNVFKIVEEDPKKKKTDDDSSSVSSRQSKKKASIKRKASMKSTAKRTGSNDKPIKVKETIRLFEPGTSERRVKEYSKNVTDVKTKNWVKPKVPDKSETVIQKSRELKLQKQVTRTSLSSEKEIPELNKEIQTLTQISDSKSEALNSQESENVANEPANLESPVFNEALKPKEVVNGHYLKKEVDHKSKYSRMYEKLKFKSLFGSNKKLSSSKDELSVEETDETTDVIVLTTPTATLNIENQIEAACKPIISQSLDSTRAVREATPELRNESFLAKAINSLVTNESSTENGSSVTSSNESNYEEITEYQMLKAISTVENRIESLTRQSLVTDETESVRPNQSSLFRTLPKNSGFSSTNDVQSSSLVEAINEALISKTRSMEAVNSQEEPIQEQNKLLSTIKKAENSNEAINELQDRSKLEEEEGYEYIKKPDEKAIANVKPDELENQNIYQTLAEAFSEKKDLKRGSIHSYESCEQYESLDDYRLDEEAVPKPDNGYEVCDSPPEPPPPRKTSDNTGTLTLPPPKRVIRSDKYASDYERIKYNDVVPPPTRPSKEHLTDTQDSTPQQVPLPPRNPTELPQPPRGQVEIPADSSESKENGDEDDEEHNYYEENIYDTIKTNAGDNGSLLSSCYEAIQQRNKLNGELNSLLYESIISKTEFQRFPFLQHAESILTLASDQKTNSIYGTALGQSITPPSERGSDNSDEWVDVSDDEDGQKRRFVV